MFVSTSLKNEVHVAVFLAALQGAYRVASSITAGIILVPTRHIRAARTILRSFFAAGITGNPNIQVL